ncbi:MAG TPA: DUF1156 domain-containing protein, partial [Syntrophorhabdus sp.]|nr:DUF1156 domain-containing protein [Syntrophorhabdus sp.]
MEYPKRLIEVDLPIKRISEHARREKSIRHGHISSLHIWWARRPLAACRAVICASLWPDPADPLCPESFRKTARTLMLEWAEKYTRLLTSQESLRRFVQIQKNPDKLSDDIFLRQALLDFIADFANWDNSTVKEYLYTSRTLTQSAHESLCGIVGTRPLVVDPFAGGGAIPIEALRVGADAFASDLNPVAVILNKVLLEYIPKYGQKLADEISKWGPYIKEQAEKELKEFYPKDSDGATPIAYIWARTIISEAPSAEKISIEVPLIGNMWLAKGAGDKCALRYKRDANNKIMKDVHEVNWVDGSKHIVYRPRFELFCPTTSSQVEQGPLRRSSVTCPISGYTTSSERVRKQFKNRRGGADDARLIAVVTKQKSGRGYRLSTKYDEEIIEKARKELKRRLINCDTPFSLIPQEELPYLRSIFNVRLLDVTSWGDLFSARQLLSLSVFAKHIRSLDKLLTQKYDKEFACAIQTCLALIFDKQADLCTSFSKWDPVAQCPRLMFVRHAIGILWDYAESCPLGDSSGSWNVIYNGFLKALESIGSDWQIGKVEMVNAENHPLPNDSTKLFFTDPPYYDAIPYADLSDFFYVWMKRILYSQYPDYFGEELTPKREEIVQLAERNPKYAYKTHENF